MIAAQLLAAQNATMECYRRAMIPEQRFEGRGENLNQANKLSHTSVVAARPNILREAARRCAPALPSAVRILAYRLQADRLGDLDTVTRRLLDRIGSGSADEVVRRAAGLNASGAGLRPAPRPTSTASARGGELSARSGRRNGFWIEQRKGTEGNPYANFSTFRDLDT
jgi:hypothetical protein